MDKSLHTLLVEDGWRLEETDHVDDLEPFKRDLRPSSKKVGDFAENCRYQWVYAESGYAVESVPDAAGRIAPPSRADIVKAKATPVDPEEVEFPGTPPKNTRLVYRAAAILCRLVEMTTKQWRAVHYRNHLLELLEPRHSGATEVRDAMDRTLFTERELSSEPGYGGPMPEDEWALVQELHDLLDEKIVPQHRTNQLPYL